jgi:hypothetical protein
VGIRPFLGDQAPVPAQDRARRDQAVPPRYLWQPPDERGEHGSIRPVQAGLGAWLCAARRLRGAAPGVRRPWTPMSGQATTAGSPAGGRSGRAEARTRLTIMPRRPSTLITQVRGTGRLLEPHRLRTTQQRRRPRPAPLGPGLPNASLAPNWTIVPGQRCARDNLKDWSCCGPVLTSNVLTCVDALPCG